MDAFFAVYLFFGSLLTLCAKPWGFPLMAAELSCNTVVFISAMRFLCRIRTSA